MSENKQIYARVHSIESFGSADGPGVRFLVFLQGCNMRCKYCHNPDTWKLPGDDYDNLKTPEELLQIDFLIEFFKLAKQDKIHTTLDTAGNPFTREPEFFDKFNELLKYTDLFMLDIKHIDDEENKKLTGFTNKNILDMAEYLSKQGKDMWIRHVLVPGINDDEKYLKRLYEFISKLKTVKKVEILPYHTLGVFKWKELGYKYSLENVEPPTKEQVERAKEILHIK